MNDLLIATSTPPFCSSAARARAVARPSSAAMSSPPAVVTGARKRMIGSPPSVKVSISVRRGRRESAGRSLTATPRWARIAPLASRIIAPTTSAVCDAPSVPADSAPVEELVQQRLVLGEDAVLRVVGEVLRDVAAALHHLLAQELPVHHELEGRRR